ncbi:hypothetical protein [Oligoflexus tunisiensis]|uniref:hypothetical protein n=1 Tax=Oligoflexus tunisiensis TaxID=708132 RepID=UPI000A99C697|nr:hypothetical protein [Oligoflexus tunisiensis]
MKFVVSLRALVPALVALMATPLSACPEAPEPREQRFENKVWQYVWDLDAAATWLGEETAPIPANVQEYRDYANGQADTDPFVLLARQREIFEKVYGPQSGVVQSFRLIEKGEVGRIGGNICVESMLMGEHLKYHPLNVPGSEFSAHIYRKGTRLKVFAAFFEQSSMAAPQVIIKAAAAHELQQNGWNLVAFLHNHPFAFDNPYGDIAGTVIPSEPDLMTFRELFQSRGLGAAWVTNGLHSARYNRADTDRLIKTEGL